MNPVVDRMYPENVLNPFLLKNGYTRVYCETDWAQIVKEKYKNALQKTTATIMDMRCPMSVHLSKECVKKDVQAIFPEIEPILIHCAKEISERENLKGKEKIIITPCQSLAQMGNKLQLNETIFYTWTSFLHKLKKPLYGKALDNTPIPLGYFSEIAVEKWSLSGEESITKYLLSEEWKKKRLIEMLYCHEGCHNGDGIYDESTQEI